MPGMMLRAYRTRHLVVRSLCSAGSGLLGPQLASASLVALSPGKRPDKAQVEAIIRRVNGDVAQFNIAVRVAAPHVMKTGCGRRNSKKKLQL